MVMFDPDKANQIPKLDLRDYLTDPATGQRIGDRRLSPEGFSRMKRLGHRGVSYAAGAGGFEAGWLGGAVVFGVGPGALVGVGVGVAAYRWTRRQLPY